MTSKPEKIGVMLCGHGSRDVGAVTEFTRLAEHLRDRLPQYPVESGFLEFARPILRDGMEKLREAGVTRILAVPGMLFAAGHVKNDLPWEVNSYAAEFPGLSVEYGRELGIDPKLLKAAAARIEEAEAACATKVDRQDTLLMVVGRGTNDSDANSNVCKVARMLWEGMGFGWAETCYSGVAHPRVDAGLERAVKLGFKRIIVFPYFLFTGILVRRIYDQADAVAAAHPDVEFVKAPYLNDHPMVIESFVERVGDILAGSVAMNCQLCKYREQVIGYEGDVGAVQAGHHHHVRGIGTDGDHGHHHHHGHDHGHGHHHHHDHGHSHGHHHHDHGHGHSHDHDHDHPHHDNEDEKA
ncbi:sirohydrochlorin chelatase [Caenispirillum bisanense]|uniref:Sirohydrochlorin cobaltochelatase n=1 Tax=Caenispirillum bisanense TaxID=414052 RepID=A0A286GVG0_9PROT|nr:sirohydrochlorin chelatase [Caenispirillum bisanense]SOD98994.1 sirohydrochlorin cobaltochelatase [Caenispirillum bisanense]